MWQGTKKNTPNGSDQEIVLLHVLNEKNKKILIKPRP